MADSSQVLVRRLKVKEQGIFSRSKELVIEGWNPRDNSDEVLCRVSQDGTAVKINKSTEAFKDSKEGDAFFAVFNGWFKFSWKVDGGTDAQNFKWIFDLAGRAKIEHPELFAAAFRGIVTADESYSSDMLEKHLGTIPFTVMHDKIIVDVLNVPAVSDEDANGRHVDMNYQLQEVRVVDEEAISLALNAAFCKFVGNDNVVVTKVSTFRATSPDREAAEMAKKRGVDKNKWTKWLWVVSVMLLVAGIWTVTDLHHQQEQVRIADEQKKRIEEERKEAEIRARIAEASRDEIRKMAKDVILSTAAQRLTNDGGRQVSDDRERIGSLVHKITPQGMNVVQGIAKNNPTELSGKDNEVVNEELEDDVGDLELCRKAANEGDADAQYNLGVMYYNGEYVDKDLDKASKWIREAAEQGNVHAQYALGVMHFKGEGVDQDLNKAMQWYQKAQTPQTRLPIKI